MRTVVIFLALASHSAARADDITSTTTKEAIEFRAGKSLIGRYQAGPSIAKPYFWPLLAPGDIPVTRDWPMEAAKPGGSTDHVHQKSVWFCHGEVIPEGMGKAVDFWTEAKAKDGKAQFGAIVCTAIGDAKALPGGGVELVTKNEWRTPAGIKILDEERTLRVWDRDGGRLISFECKLIASVCPITFGDTKEGSFGIRVHDELRPESKVGTTVTTSGGKVIRSPAKDDLSVWGQPAEWIDYSGTVGGKACGVAVFEHKENTQRRGWHARAYGLVAANPFAREKSGFPSQKGKSELVKMAKGGTLTLRYAVYAHVGDAKSGKVAEAYEAFCK